MTPGMGRVEARTEEDWTSNHVLGTETERQGMGMWEETTKPRVEDI